MAKMDKVEEPGDGQPQDVNPELAFRDAWKKHQEIRTVLTIKGEVRSGLKPSESQRAQGIRRSFGL